MAELIELKAQSFKVENKFYKYEKVEMQFRISIISQWSM
jgi:hypothetical protein